MTPSIKENHVNILLNKSITFINFTSTYQKKIIDKQDIVDFQKKSLLQNRKYFPKHTF